MLPEDALKYMEDLVNEPIHHPRCWICGQFVPKKQSQYIVLHNTPMIGNMSVNIIKKCFMTNWYDLEDKLTQSEISEIKLSRKWRKFARFIKPVARRPLTLVMGRKATSDKYTKKF